MVLKNNLAIANGFGVTILSDMVYRPWSLEGKKIEARPILDLVPHMEAGMIWKRDVQLERPVEALRQFLPCQWQLTRIDRNRSRQAASFSITKIARIKKPAIKRV